MPIAVRCIEGNRSGPSLLVLAGVHGDEYEPMVAVRWLAARLDPAELCGRVLLVPIVNEPAFRRASRTAEDGLDLARTCPGRVDGSITETLAAQVSTLIREADFLMDLHTGGRRYSLGTLAGYMLHADANVLRTQRRMARAFGCPLVWGTDASLPGRTLSVARDASVPAIYTECGGGGAFDPALVEPLVQGCLNVMGVLGLLEEPRSIPEPRWTMEDSRPNSGHLQGCHRSPRDGFFERDHNRSLFERIRVGDRLGTIYDAFGDSAIPVIAEVPGLLIGLHASEFVHAGDGLAIVVEIELTSPGSASGSVP